MIIWTYKANAQSTGSVTVSGDFDKFYPTLWSDGGWNNNASSKLEIGRSNVHTDSDWRGALKATFHFRINQWGNGANFINTEIVQHHNAMTDPDSDKVFTVSNVDFIAGWKDGSVANSTASIIIWLRGGGTTYYFKSEYPTTTLVFDGVANPLPYQEVNGPSHTYKTSKDAYVNSYGSSKEGTAYYTGNAPSYFVGDLGIGTLDTKGYKLAVAGNMIAESVKVSLQGTWPDFVFTRDYKLPPLKETEKHIKEKGYLPGIPSQAEVKTNGIDLGEMNTKLLQKIEELTLHLIQQDKRIMNLEAQNKVMVNEIKKIKN